MSFTKIQSGFQPRQGQAATVEMMVNGGPGKYLANLPGGYGKTLTALMAYYELKERGEVNRFLYVSPGATKIFEFDVDLRKNCNKLGVKPIGKGLCIVNDAFAIKEHQRNTHEFFAATVQYGINSQGHLIDTLVSSGRWFVCVDECHHYTFENKFGGLLDRINYGYLLGLSATPVNYQAPGYFTGLPVSNVTTVSLSDAVREGAIRPIKYYTADYFVELMMQDGIHCTLTTSELSDMVETEGLKISQYETQKQLRYTDKYISPLFIKAVDLYNELIDRDEAEYIRQNGEPPARPLHQILVFADTVSLAKNYVKLINATLGEPDFAEWVGTGDHGRNNDENFKIIERYKNGELKCLVQVSMAGEGFDNPPSSVIVYLSLQYNGNQVTQKIMRGMRRNYMIQNKDYDYGHVIVPTDSRAIEEIERLFKQLDVTGDLKEKMEREEMDRQSMNPWDEPVYEFDFSVLQDVELKEWQQFEITKQQMESIKMDLNNRSWEVPQDKLEAAIASVLFKQKSEAVEEMNREQVRNQIKKQTGALASRIVRINHPNGAINKDSIGYAIKSIHSQYARTFGVRTKEMTFDELMHKYNWVTELAKSISESRNLPIWLRK